MSIVTRPHLTSCAIDYIIRAAAPVGLAVATFVAVPVAAQTALDTATVTIPDASRKPSTDITVIKERTASGFTVSVTNTGPEPVSGIVVIDTVNRGQTCRPTNPVAVTASGAPAGASPAGGSTIANLTGQGIALGTLNSGQTATLTFSCQGN